MRDLTKPILLALLFLTLGVIVLGVLLRGAFTLAAGRPNESSVPPTRTIPDYVLASPVAGKTIHWTARQTIFVENGPDPANGKPTLQDTWVQVGADGIPVRGHNLSLLEDGSFQQELLVTPESTILVLGPGYPTITPDGMNNCRQTLAPYTDEQRSGMLPAFLDANKLAAAGWKPSNLPPPAYPPSMNPVDAVPETIIGAHDTLSGWTSEETENGTTHTSRVLLGELGRVFASYSKRTNVSGDLAAESVWLNSPIEVYATGTFLEKAFQLSSQSAEVCHE